MSRRRRTQPASGDVAAVAVEVDAADDGQRPDVVWLDNGRLRLGFVPDLGGRLLSARLDGAETLWRNPTLLDDALHPVPGHRPAPVGGPMSAWHNYGGDKTWPAPQGWSGPGQWAGPPDPVLDSGPYEYAVAQRDTAATLTLTSGADPRTGLVLTRSITLRAGETAVDVELQARNHSDDGVTWALWNVTQRTAGAPGDGGVHVGTEPGAHTVVPLAEGTGAPTHDVVGPDQLRVPHQDVVGKLGFPGAAGWLAHVAGGSTTTQAFTVEADAEYPDGGSRVEVWMEYPLEQPLAHLGDLWPTARIVEIEILGPSRRLAPGEVSTLRYRAGLTRSAGPVAAVAPAGHWEVGPHADGAALTGRFAAYASGVLLAGATLTPIGPVRAGAMNDVHADDDAVRSLPAGTRLVLREDGSGRLVDAGTTTEPR